MSKRALLAIVEYRRVLKSYYDKGADFVRGQLFALDAIENELKPKKKEAEKE